MRRCQSCGAQTTRKWERGGVWCAACFRPIAPKVVDILDWIMRKRAAIQIPLFDPKEPR